MDHHTEALHNWIRDVVQKTLAIMMRPGRYLLVESYDPATGTAKGKFKPGDEPSGWIPVMTGFAGNGIGLAMPPSPNDVVWVSFQEGSLSSGAITHRLWNKNSPPPGAQSGEVWLQHANGQTIKMNNDKTMTLIGQNSNNQLFDANGNIVWSFDNPTVRYARYQKQGDNSAPKRVMLEDMTVSNILRAQNG